MEDKAVGILDENRIMAIATARPDGWPQATMVGYANDGILLYFIVSRLGQKFENIQRDDRISLAIGRDFHDPSSIKALSIAAYAHPGFESSSRRILPTQRLCGRSRPSLPSSITQRASAMRTCLRSRQAASK
jgi:hypothetical protein